LDALAEHEITALRISGGERPQGCQEDPTGIVPAPARSRPTLQSSLLFAGVFAVCALAEPDSASAQIGAPGDPICRIPFSTRSSVTQKGRKPAVDSALPGSAASPLPGISPSDQDTGRLEYSVKAALLCHFFELVEWPSGLSTAKEPTFTIGILGRNPFGESLRILSGKTVAGRRLVVRQLSGTQEAARCQLVFVSSSEKAQLTEIFKTLTQFPVLTVGETPGFAENGGMINLRVEGTKIWLEINPAAAERAHLVLHPKLLKMATLVAAPIFSPKRSFDGYI
jgi:hypothetical protein